MSRNLKIDDVQPGSLYIDDATKNDLHNRVSTLIISTCDREIITITTIDNSYTGRCTMLVDSLDFTNLNGFMNRFATYSFKP